MQRSQAALYQSFDLTILCENHVIIQSEKRQDVPVKDMCCRIDCHILKKDAIVSDRGADSTIENIQFKSLHSTVGCLQKRILTTQLICTHENRNNIALYQRRQPGTRCMVRGRNKWDWPAACSIGEMRLMDQEPAGLSHERFFMLIASVCNIGVPM